MSTLTLLVRMHTFTSWPCAVSVQQHLHRCLSGPITSWLR